ncbi:hypothetical protein I546_1262 [Mycobacterium kansasii 732]|nr:hypothetical protein I546_1262 [Mycobacterium kansasii 732]
MSAKEERASLVAVRDVADNRGRGRMGSGHPATVSIIP